MNPAKNNEAILLFRYPSAAVGTTCGKSECPHFPAQILKDGPCHPAGLPVTPMKSNAAACVASTNQSGLNPKLRKMFFSVFIGSTPMQERPIMLRFARLRSQSIAATVPITALTAWAPASISRQRCTGFSTGASVLSAKQPARAAHTSKFFWIDVTIRLQSG